MIWDWTHFEPSKEMSLYWHKTMDDLLEVYPFLTLIIESKTLIALVRCDDSYNEHVFMIFSEDR